MVDSTRNKALMKLNLQIPLFGSLDTNILIDFTSGTYLTNVPFLNICDKEPIGETLIAEPFPKEL